MMILGIHLLGERYEELLLETESRIMLSVVLHRHKMTITSSISVTAMLFFAAL